MGNFQRPTIRLEFDDESSNPGLVVRGRRLTLGEVRRWDRLKDQLSDEELSDDRREKIENDLLAVLFPSTEDHGKYAVNGLPVREWNMVDDEGGDAETPVPLPTKETLEDYDQATLIEIMNGFLLHSRARRVSRPLPKPSDDTPSSVEASMQTVPR